MKQQFSSIFSVLRKVIVYIATIAAILFYMFAFSLVLGIVYLVKTYSLSGLWLALSIPFISCLIVIYLGTKIIWNDIVHHKFFRVHRQR